MPELLSINYERSYNSDFISCAALFTLIFLVLAIYIPVLIVYYSGGKLNI